MAQHCIVDRLGWDYYFVVLLTDSDSIFKHYCTSCGFKHISCSSLIFVWGQVFPVGNFPGECFNSKLQLGKMHCEKLLFFGRTLESTLASWPCHFLESFWQSRLLFLASTSDILKTRFLFDMDLNRLPVWSGCRLRFNMYIRILLYICINLYIYFLDLYIMLFLYIDNMVFN